MTAQLKFAVKPWRRPAEAVSLVLPFPPSLNNLFFNTGRGRAITDAYKKWRFEAGLELMRQRPGCVYGAVDITLTLGEPEHKRRIDLDGCCKAPIDLLVEHQVIEGDDRRFVRKITAAWCGKTQGCRMEIRKCCQIMPS